MADMYANIFKQFNSNIFNIISIIGSTWYDLRLLKSQGFSDVIIVKNVRPLSLDHLLIYICISFFNLYRSLGL